MGWGFKGLGFGFRGLGFGFRGSGVWCGEFRVWGLGLEDLLAADGRDPVREYLFSIRACREGSGCRVQRPGSCPDGMRQASPGRFRVHG